MANTDFSSQKINISGGLVPTTTDTPVDKRGRIETLEEMESIPYPAVSMHVYVKSTKKEYVVDTLKSKVVQGIEIPNSVIDTYHEVGASASEVAELKEEILALIKQFKELQGDEGSESESSESLDNLSEIIKFLSGFTNKATLKEALQELVDSDDTTDETEYGDVFQ